MMLYLAFIIACTPGELKGYSSRFLALNSFGGLLYISTALSSTPLLTAEAGLIWWKINILGLAFHLLLSRLDIFALSDGLKTLKFPDKLILLIVTAFRHIDIIEDEYLKLQRSAKLRGFTPALSVHTWETYSSQIAMTLIKSWNRASAIHAAMVLRGFEGKFHLLSDSEPSKPDYLKACLAVLVSLAPIFLLSI